MTPELPTPKRSNKAIYIVFIILLIGANVFLYLNNRNTSTTLETVSTEKEKLDSTYKQLQHDYEKALAEIEEFKGENAALDSLVRIKQYALDERKKEIQKILMKTNLDKQDLDRARVLIEQLKREKDRIVLQFDSLKIAYQTLNTKLDTVSSHLDRSKKQVNKLQTENEVLAEAANVLHLTNISLMGAKEKGGKEKETNSVRHLEYLRISFVVERNNVVASGIKTIYYRIANPENKLIYNPNKGGGIMISKEDNAEVRYTGKAEFDYTNAKKPISIKWIPESKLQKGDYTIEFYSEGYSIGTAKLTLNNSLL
jgi:archaellum component FlaC